jgi:hypothetical protein
LGTVHIVGQWQPIVNWAFFDVIFALAPLVLTFAMVKLLGMGTPWHTVLKDGELFIFSSTVLASYVGIVLFQEDKLSLADVLIVCAAILFLFVSACLFTLTSYFKFTGQPLPGQKRFGFTSISCACVAALLGYAVVLAT